MAEPIVLVDTSQIRDGKLDDVKAAFHELTGFVETHEPRPIAYNVYIDEPWMRVTVMQIHPDAGSMEFHLDVAGPRFGRFADLLKLVSVDVYGKPSEEVLRRLSEKVDMLGDATIAVHDHHAGFARFEER